MIMTNSGTWGSALRVEGASIESYFSRLVENSRPPSRGGNTGAWHRHVLTIEGDAYSFLAAHAGKFVYKSETVSFDWDWDGSQRHRNVDVASLVAYKPDGSPVVRGNRASKGWRTATTKAPGRRSERES